MLEFSFPKTDVLVFLDFVKGGSTYTRLCTKPFWDRQRKLVVLLRCKKIGKKT